MTTKDEQAPSADRSAKAVKITREEIERVKARALRSNAISVPIFKSSILDLCEIALEAIDPLITPPAQPASQGPLQAEAFRAAAKAVISDIADRSGFGAIRDVDAKVVEEMVTELAEVIRDAISADHDAKEAK